MAHCMNHGIKYYSSKSVNVQLQVSWVTKSVCAMDMQDNTLLMKQLIPFKIIQENKLFSL